MKLRPFDAWAARRGRDEPGERGRYADERSLELGAPCAKRSTRALPSGNVITWMRRWYRTAIGDAAYVLDWSIGEVRARA